jgi:uncharacterized protein (DUF1697 family)
MNTFIALFRGINVGGNNIIPMKELSSLMTDHGYTNVKTYIQSGNVVFNSKHEPHSELGELVERNFGFKPEVLILDSKDLTQAMENNPYSPTEGKLCHFSFCKSFPETVDIAKLRELKTDTEQFCIKGRVFYLHAPDGIGRSKLAANAEKCLGEPVTARNLNTVNKLSEMVGNI